MPDCGERMDGVIVQVGSLRPLDEDYPLAVLIERDAELQLIREYVENKDLNVWVEGKPGVGKTHTARFYAKQSGLENGVRVIYVHADASIKDAVCHGQKAYGLQIPRKEICGTRFAEEFVKTYPDADRYVLIIDEPERVWARRDVATFVHTYYDAMLSSHKAFNIVFVSGRINLQKAESFFPRETLSRLQLKSVIFSVYNVRQIIQILEQRLAYVYSTPGQYDRHVVALIAKHIFQHANGDIRQALGITKYAVQTADNLGRPLTEEIVLEAIEWGKVNWLKGKILKDFSPHTAYMLYQTAILSLETNTLTIDCPSIVRRYRQTIQQIGQDPIGQTSLYNGFKEIASEGLVKQSYVTTETTYQATLTFDEAKDRDRIIKIGQSINWEERFAGL